MADIEIFEDDLAYHSSYARGGAGRGTAYERRQDTAPDIEQPSRAGALVQWAGAIVSFGLVVGMGVWAYQLTMRDVSGVPVIRALEGPMRVPPADPGGVQADHQGLAVNRIAEGEEAAPVPDRIVLAPPPIDLEQFSVATTSASASASGPAPEAEVLPTPSAASAETQALIDRLMARGEPLLAAPESDAVPLEDSDVATAVSAPAPPPEAASAAPAIIPASVPGVARSLRPATRPASIRAMAPAALVVGADGGASQSDVALTALEIDPDALPEGTRLVQLGAFDTADVARSEWERLAGQFPDFFDGRARIIQEASSGGSSFYRLRAHGFDDLAASRRFCAALVAQNTACIPVTVR